jgi:amino acid transporter
VALSKHKQPSLFSAIAVGVSSIIGSGWLFASYYAAQYTGGAAILSWIIGALIAFVIAVLLAEISTMYRQRGLLARVLTISHNRDYGFVVAISNWLGVVITIPSEAEATIQYIGTASKRFSPYVFQNHHLTAIGIVLVCALMMLYGLINFWGIRALAKVNNILSVFKIIIPLLTAGILFATSFHSANFTAYHHTLVPYGHDKIFSAIIVSGIFYAFYGFGTITSFSSELKNPKKNIPIALMACILICLIIYLLLQASFIGALPTAMIQHGWHTLNFSSPLVQLLLLFNLNFWSIVLYIDAAISPSGTAIIYTGSATRMVTGMAEDKQFPKPFTQIHPIYNLSRRSLGLTLFVCLIMVIFFRNWQKIMIVVTTFQLITCIAVPIAFSKLRLIKPHKHRAFRVPCGHLLGFCVYLTLTYILIHAGVTPLTMSLLLHIFLFATYSFSYYRRSFIGMVQAFLSSWTIFAYLAYAAIYGYITAQGWLLQPAVLMLFFLLSSGLYWLMLNQKKVHLQDRRKPTSAT